MQNAAKVGFLVVVFVALLFGACQILGRSLFKQPVNSYEILFADASGVAEGTKVLMAGVKVGQVKSISLESPQLARATIEIDKSVKIPENSTAVLPGSLIGFGDTPIRIMPPAQFTGRFLADHGTIVGSQLSPLEGLLPNTKETMAELTKTLAATRHLIENQKITDKVEALLVSSQGAMASFQSIAGKVDLLLTENRANLNKALKSATIAMEEVKETTVAVRKLASDPQWKNKVGALLDGLNATMQKADKLVADFDSFANDPDLKQSLKATLANTQTITENGTKISANAEEITKNGIIISQKAIDLTDKANALAEEAKKVLEKFGGFFDKKPGKAVLSGIGASMDLNRETDPNHWRTDAEFRIPIGQDSLRLGLFDAFEANKITAQLGRPFGGGGEYWYGVYASKPGLGVEYPLASRLFVRGDFFDINHPRADLRVRLEFGNGFYSYFGVNKLLDRNAPTFGIGFRK